MITGATVAVPKPCVVRALLLPQPRTEVLVLRACFRVGIEYSLTATGRV